MKILLFLLMFMDGSKQPLPTHITQSRIEYPGFPTDTLTTDSVEFCVVSDVPYCENTTPMNVIFIFNPYDSTMTEKSNEMISGTINEFKILSIEQDYVGPIKFTRYGLISKFDQYKKNVYVMDKLNDIDFIILFCITDKEVYKVSFFK